MTCAHEETAQENLASHSIIPTQRNPTSAPVHLSNVRKPLHMPLKAILDKQQKQAESTSMALKEAQNAMQTAEEVLQSTISLIKDESDGRKHIKDLKKELAYQEKIQINKEHKVDGLIKHYEEPKQDRRQLSKPAPTLAFTSQFQNSLDQGMAKWMLQ